MGNEKKSTFPYENLRIALQNVDFLAGFPVEPEMKLAVFRLDTGGGQLFINAQNAVKNVGLLFAVDEKDRVAGIIEDRQREAEAFVFDLRMFQRNNAACLLHPFRNNREQRRRVPVLPRAEQNQVEAGKFADLRAEKFS